MDRENTYFREALKLHTLKECSVLQFDENTSDQRVIVKITEIQAGFLCFLFIRLLDVLEIQPIS